jgi:ATP-dependent exoDNAse (exonuclease V) alpha subunit
MHNSNLSAPERPAKRRPLALSTEQVEAALTVERWLKNPNANQVFMVAGGAGTGKTTLAQHLSDRHDGVICLAPTNKAAHRLRQMGCEASTIHSAIYFPERLPNGRLVFSFNEQSRIADANFVIVDEALMVDRAVGGDLAWFGRPIVAFGDPFQLPPVDGASYFDDEPDIMLTEIHRQARGNPIIKMAARIRSGERLPYGDYGDGCSVIRQRDLDPDMLLDADQVLVGTHVRRQKVTAEMRRGLGRRSSLPEPGDKLIACRTDYEQALFLNGSMWTVEEVQLLSARKLIQMRLASDDSDDSTINVCIDRRNFEAETGPFLFAQAITVHKAQGSQWDSVVVFDESAVFREHRARWLYSAATRA